MVSASPCPAVRVASRADCGHEQHKCERNPELGSAEDAAASADGWLVNVDGLPLDLLHVDRHHLDLVCHLRVGGERRQVEQGVGESAERLTSDWRKGCLHARCVRLQH